MVTRRIDGMTITELKSSLKNVKTRKKDLEQKESSFQTHLDLFLDGISPLLNDLPKDSGAVSREARDIMGKYHVNHDLGWGEITQETISGFFDNPFTKLLHRLGYMEREIVNAIKKKEKDCRK